MANQSKHTTTDKSIGASMKSKKSDIPFGSRQRRLLSETIQVEDE